MLDLTDQRYSNILNEARSKHTQAVQNRIDEVGKKGDVVDVTKGLYAIARETIEAEKEAFELKQRTEVASEVKNVLDSWVRFEAQQREAEQKLVTESVISKVAEGLRDDKLQKQILESAVADIESTCPIDSPRRARQGQEDLIVAIAPIATPGYENATRWARRFRCAISSALRTRFSPAATTLGAGGVGGASSLTSAGFAGRGSCAVAVGSGPCRK